jgi:hypothetical protein
MDNEFRPTSYPNTSMSSSPFSHRRKVSEIVQKARRQSHRAHGTQPFSFQHQSDTNESTSTSANGDSPPLIVNRSQTIPTSSSQDWQQDEHHHQQQHAPQRVERVLSAPNPHTWHQDIESGNVRQNTSDDEPQQLDSINNIDDIKTAASPLGRRPSLASSATVSTAVSSPTSQSTTPSGTTPIAGRHRQHTSSASKRRSRSNRTSRQSRQTTLSFQPVLQDALLSEQVNRRRQRQQIRLDIRQLCCGRPWESLEVQNDSRSTRYGTLSRMSSLGDGLDVVPQGLSLLKLARDVAEQLDKNLFWDLDFPVGLFNELTNVFAKHSPETTSLARMSKRIVTNMIADCIDTLKVGETGQHREALVSAGVVLMSRLFPEEVDTDDETPLMDMISRLVNGNQDLLETKIKILLDHIKSLIPQLGQTGVLDTDNNNRNNSSNSAEYATRSVLQLKPNECDCWEDLHNSVHVAAWKFELVLNSIILVVERVLRKHDANDVTVLLNSENIRLLTQKVSKVLLRVLRTDMDKSVTELSDEALRVLITTDYFLFAPRAILYRQACDTKQLTSGEFVALSGECMLHSAKASFHRHLSELRMSTERKQLYQAGFWVTFVIGAILLGLVAYTLSKASKLNGFVDKEMFRYRCTNVFGNHIPERFILANLNVTSLPGVAGCVLQGACSTLDCEWGNMKYAFVVLTSVAILALMFFEILNNLFAFPTRSIIFSALLASNFFADPRVVLHPGDRNVLRGLDADDFHPTLALGVPNSKWIFHQWMVMLSVATVGLAVLIHQRHTIPWFQHKTSAELLVQTPGMSGKVFVIVIAVSLLSGFGYLVSAIVAAVLQLSVFPELYNFESILITSRNPANAVGFTAFFIATLLCAGSYSLLEYIVGRWNTVYERLHFELERVTTVCYMRCCHVQLAGDCVRTFAVFDPAPHSDSDCDCPCDCDCNCDSDCHCGESSHSEHSQDSKTSTGIRRRYATLRGVREEQILESEQNVETSDCSDKWPQESDAQSDASSLATHSHSMIDHGQSDSAVALHDIEMIQTSSAGSLQLQPHPYKMGLGAQDDDDE